MKTLDLLAGMQRNIDAYVEEIGGEVEEFQAMLQHSQATVKKLEAQLVDRQFEITRIVKGEHLDRLSDKDLSWLSSQLKETQKKIEKIQVDISVQSADDATGEQRKRIANVLRLSRAAPADGGGRLRSLVFLQAMLRKELGNLSNLPSGDPEDHSHLQIKSKQFLHFLVDNLHCILLQRKDLPQLIRRFQSQSTQSVVPLWIRMRSAPSHFFAFTFFVFLQFISHSAARRWTRMRYHR